MSEAGRARLTEIISQLSRRMEIRSDAVQLDLAPRDWSANAYVYSHLGASHLVVPLGFFKLLESQPGQAKAILAHELAHIAQGDEQLWSLARLYWHISGYLIPVRLVGLFATLAQVGEAEWLQGFVPSIGGFALLVIFRNNIKKYVATSEEIADRGAVICGLAHELRLALTNLDRSHGEQEQGFHPRVGQRVRAISELQPKL